MMNLPGSVDIEKVMRQSFVSTDEGTVTNVADALDFIGEGLHRIAKVMEEDETRGIAAALHNLVDVKRDIG